MKLSAAQLRMIADNLDSLTKIKAVVREFEFSNMICKVEKYNAQDQRDQDQYFLVGIDDGTEEHQVASRSFE